MSYKGWGILVTLLLSTASLTLAAVPQEKGSAAKPTSSQKKPVTTKAAATKPAVNPVPVAVKMQTLTCRQVTDDFANGPEDEVYLTVAIRTPDGKKSNRRIPDGEWDMHPDKPGKQHLSDVSLWAGALGEGQSVEVTVFVSEKDSGKTVSDAVGGALEQASAQNNRPWYLEVAKFLSGFLENDDDVVGALVGTFTNKGGKITATWQPIDGYTTKGGGPNKAGCPQNPQCDAAFFEMRNAKSLYFGYFRPGL